MNELPFDGVLCDFDGVVHLWDPDGMAALDRARGLAEGTLASTAFEPELLYSAVTVRLTDEQWRSQVADDLTGLCGSSERAGELVATWGALTGRVDRAAVRPLLDIGLDAGPGARPSVGPRPWSSASRT
ncbi:hypothetical protein [Streptomyces sp. MBT27]|uniref:hypothetical protein n=1 Tax=Streptomyces sp. MBT27 TaxID=1488356 RepID=UPI00141E7DD3|nr:hypothetical protein [Streptomyces sp. MBT27]